MLNSYCIKSACQVGSPTQVVPRVKSDLVLLPPGMVFTFVKGRGLPTLHERTEIIIFISER